MSVHITITIGTTTIDTGGDFDGIMETVERLVLLRALRLGFGSVASAARALRMHRRTMQRRLRKLGIDPAKVMG